MIRPNLLSVSPTYAEAALGFRGWEMSSEGMLMSTGIGAVTWRPGVNLAYCQAHQAPANNCQCGLYACHQLDDLDEIAGPCPIIGAIAARGQLEIHQDGFRAAEAVILAIAPGSNIYPHERSHLVEIAAFYQVPLVSPAELVSFGQEYAQAVPVGDRPIAPPPVVRPGQSWKYLLAFFISLVVSVAAIAVSYNLLGSIWIKLALIVIMLDICALLAATDAWRPLFLMIFVMLLFLGGLRAFGSSLPSTPSRSAPTTTMKTTKPTNTTTALLTATSKLAVTTIGFDAQQYQLIHHHWPVRSQLPITRAVGHILPDLQLKNAGRCLQLRWQSLTGQQDQRFCPIDRHRP